MTDLYTRLSGYSDERALLDRALDAPHGLKVDAQTPGAATSLRHRLNKLRALDREVNAKVYPDPNSPLHAKSSYDSLVITLSARFVRIEKRRLPDDLTIEEF